MINIKWPIKMILKGDAITYRILFIVISFLTAWCDIPITTAAAQSLVVFFSVGLTTGISAVKILTCSKYSKFLYASRDYVLDTRPIYQIRSYITHSINWSLISALLSIGLLIRPGTDYRMAQYGDLAIDIQGFAVCNVFTCLSYGVFSVAIFFLLRLIRILLNYMIEEAQEK